MKIVIAPDSFKESLSAVSVAACIEKLTRRYGRALLDALPPFVREIDGVSQGG